MHSPSCPLSNAPWTQPTSSSQMAPNFHYPLPTRQKFLPSSQEFWTNFWPRCAESVWSAPSLRLWKHWCSYKQIYVDWACCPEIESVNRGIAFSELCSPIWVKITMWWMRRWGWAVCWCWSRRCLPWAMWSQKMLLWDNYSAWLISLAILGKDFKNNDFLFLYEKVEFFKKFEFFS